MKAGSELERLLALMARLRAPDGCPWDREQTVRSLRPFILEEAYELVEAIDASDSSRIREELGDLLLEIVFVNQIAEEEGAFRMEDVVRGIHDKLVRRHPHVFETGPATDAGEALATATPPAVSVKTIENHRANAMRKLGTHSVGDVVRAAIRANAAHRP